MIFLSLFFSIVIMAKPMETLRCMNLIPADSQLFPCEAELLKTPFFEESTTQNYGLKDVLSTEINVSTSGRLTLLVQNIGSAEFKYHWPFSIVPVCPFYKLCDVEVALRFKDELSRLKPDVVFIQEALSLNQMKGQDVPFISMLPKNYTVICSPGAKEMFEICIAWNNEVVSNSEPCTAVVGADGGALRCNLTVNGLKIQMINTHPSAWDPVDREQVLRALWKKLLDRQHPSIVGGDFNTQMGTFGFDDKIPYPPEFGTIFGQHRSGYGRASPAESFFGYVRQKSVKVNSTVFMEKIDHVFSNFGKPLMVKVGNHEGFDWGPAMWQFFPTFGPKTDHLPIFAELEWK